MIFLKTPLQNLICKSILQEKPANPCVCWLLALQNIFVTQQVVVVDV
jgi:hypothetical protein